MGKNLFSLNRNILLLKTLLYMLNGKAPKDIEVEAIDKALVLHADHELNASTFTARVCVATYLICIQASQLLSVH